MGVLTIAHLGTLDFVVARDNVVFLGPPGTGKTHLATGPAIRACHGRWGEVFGDDVLAAAMIDRLVVVPREVVNAV